MVSTAPIGVLMCVALKLKIPIIIEGINDGCDTISVKQKTSPKTAAFCIPVFEIILATI